MNVQGDFARGSDDWSDLLPFFCTLAGTHDLAAMSVAPELMERTIEFDLYLGNVLCKGIRGTHE